MSDLNGTKNTCYRHGYAVGLKRGVKLKTEYRIWLKMRERCYSEKCQQYKDYGGRGIRICDRWYGPGGFIKFLGDMGPRPSSGHSLDRIGNNKGYSPSNCRWATRTEQNRNSRHNRLIKFNGKTQCMTAWAEEFGINKGTFQRRVATCGVKVAMELGSSHGGKGGVLLRKRTRLVSLGGRTMPIGTWAREVGMSRTTIIRRLAKGLSIEQALTAPPRSSKHGARRGKGRQ